MMETEARYFATEDAVPAEWQPGDVLLDLYEVLGVLGQGGMGKVYKVLHRGWGLELAVKSPRPEFMGTEQGRSSFIREAETWVNLGLHTHTVSCYYVRTLGYIPRVFAEYVEGGSLEDWIKGRLYEGDPASIVARILDVAIQVAWGLHYAHEAGLIHQDVKPANVMMTDSGTAKVTDFGLAKARLSSEPVRPLVPQAGMSVVIPGAGVCTPEYASPEQIKGEPLSRRTDIWSWACSVLEMVAGERPGFGPAARGTLADYRAGERRADLPPAPPALLQLLESCFAENPEARPRTMRDCAQALVDMYPAIVGERYSRPEPAPADLQADALNNRAVSLLDLGYSHEAEKLLERALGVDPHHLNATHNLVLLQWRTGLLPEKVMLGRMRKVRAAHAATWEDPYLMGWVHVERGDAEPAQAALREAHAAAGDDPAAQRLILEAEQALQSGSRGLGTLRGHQGEVYAVAMAPDGRLAVSGGADGLVRAWNLGAAAPEFVLAGHVGPVGGLCVTSDGRVAVSAGADTTARVWDLEKRRQRLTLTHSWSLRHPAASADGSLILAASMDKTIVVWDGLTGDPRGRLVGHTEGVLGLAIDPEARFAVSASEDGTIRVWDLSQGTCLQVLAGHTGPVTSVALTPDGRLAVSGSADGTLRTWDPLTGRCLRTLEGHTGAVKSVAVSAAGYVAVSAGADDTVRAWDLVHGRGIAILRGHTGTVNGVALTWDGSLALSASSDGLVAAWQINPVAAPLALVRPRRSEEVLAARLRFRSLVEEARAAMKAGRWKAAVDAVAGARQLPGYERSPECLAIWDDLYPRAMRGGLRGTSSDTTLKGHATAVKGTAVTPDGARAVTVGADGGALVWNLASGQSGRALEGFRSPQQKAIGAAITPDARFVFLPAGPDAIAQWDVATGRCLRRLAGHGHFVTALALSPDGRLLCSASADGTLRVWSLAAGKCLQALDARSGWLYAAGLSADGRVAAGAGADGSIRIWDTVAGQVLRRLEGHQQPIASLYLTPDTRHLVSGSLDKTVRIWKVGSGTCQWTLEGHRGGVLAVAMTPDGRVAVSAGEDATVRVWDVARGHCLRVLEGHAAAVGAVDITSDARMVLSGSDDQTVRLWYLDWDLIPHDAAAWDEGARPCLEVFLACRARPGGFLRGSKPTWTDAEFKDLLRELSYWGYGWLRPEGVQQELKAMAASWNAPPSLS